MHKVVQYLDDQDKTEFGFLLLTV